mgnify:CR=1 FL=1
MKRYEYKVITTLFRLERKLNQLGYEGWKVVAGTKGSLVLMRESEN